MKRLYSVVFAPATIANASGDYDLFYIAPADDKPIWIVGWDLAQYSDLSDAAEEVLRLAIVRGHTSASSGGNSVTANDTYKTGANFSFTARTVDTTIAASGTTVTPWVGGHNIRIAPAPFFLPEPLWIPCTQADTSIVLRLGTAVADDITLSGTLWVVEAG